MFFSRNSCVFLHFSHFSAFLVFWFVQFNLQKVFSRCNFCKIVPIECEICFKSIKNCNKEQKRSEMVQNADFFREVNYKTTKFSFFLRKHDFISHIYIYYSFSVILHHNSFKCHKRINKIIFPQVDHMPSIRNCSQQIIFLSTQYKKCNSIQAPQLGQ